MKVVVQRSKNASVKVDNKIVGEINNGLVLLVGFTHTDNEENVNKMIDKILKLRIFDDENNVMNKNVLETGGKILSISQFTLYADAKKGNRPSYINAMKNCEAKILYEYFNKKISEKIETSVGVFGADMIVSLQNDGPTTILLEN